MYVLLCFIISKNNTSALKKYNMGGKCMQALATVACGAGTTMIGLLYVWPSYTLNLYMAQNQTILLAPMTDFEASLLGGLPSLGAIFGALCVGPVIAHVGRKKGGCVLTIPYTLCWTIIEAFPNATAILIARFLGGLSAGAFAAFCQMFIAEIADKSIRGALASFPIVTSCIGTVLSYTLGWIASYHVIIWVNLSVCVLTYILFAFTVESPVYLVKQNKEKEALEAIAKYRGEPVSSVIVISEYTRLRHTLYPTGATEPLAGNKYTYEENLPPKFKKVYNFRELFVSPASRRAFIIVAVIMILQIFMGLLPLQIYAKDVFLIAAPDLSPHLCSVILALVLLLGIVIGTASVDTFGRRVLLIGSSLLVAVTLVSAGVMIHMTGTPSWVIAITLLLSSFSYYLGAVFMPFVLATEVFHPEVQHTASMLLVEIMWLSEFLVSTIFPYLTKYLELYGTFYVFAGMAAANAIFSYFMVPETKGMHVQDVLKLFYD